MGLAGGAAAARGAAAAVAATGTAAAGAPAGSPNRAVTSASVRAGRLLRLRRACSAAMADLLHFFPAASHFSTSGLKPVVWAVATEAGAAAAAVVVAGAAAAGAAVTPPASFSQGS